MGSGVQRWDQVFKFYSFCFLAIGIYDVYIRLGVQEATR
jgi:hypothetical protein